MIFDKERIATWLRACEDNASEVALLKSHQELQKRHDAAEALLRKAVVNVVSADLAENIEGWLAAT